MPLYRNFVDFVSNQVISGIKTFLNRVVISDTTTSTTTTTGALTVAGGMGVGGQLFTGGNIQISNPRDGNSDLTIVANFGATSGMATNATIPALNFRANGGVANEGMNARIAASYESLVVVGGTRLSFFTRASSFGALNENMVLKANGNLLIGTTTDNGIDKVQVAGSINAALTSDSTALNISQNAGVRSLIFGNQGLLCNTAATFGRSARTGIAVLEISTASASLVGLLVQGILSQTANLQQWRNSANTVLASVDATGIITAPQFRQSVNSTPPASVTDTGILGEIRIDSNFIYYCVANNSWKRAALSTW